jgi:hypothetical protein
MRIKKLNNAMNRKRQLSKQHSKMNTRRQEFFIQGIIQNLEQDTGNSNNAISNNLL